MEKSNFILDTHVFIWAMEGNKRLPADIKNKISDPKNIVFISVATIWEIVIKRKLGKMKIKFDLESSAKTAGVGIIPIQTAHVLYTEKLPFYHKDPFDRIIIAQSNVENLILITHDEDILKYKVISSLKV